MDWNIRKLTCKQLMYQLTPLNGFITPPTGWLKTIRKAIGMSTAQLAKKCAVSTQRILRIEQDEILGRTTLTTLEKTAEQLGCRLVYAFVPKKDFLKIIEEQAEKKALEKLNRISHSMVLEDQKVVNKMQKDQLDLLKDQLMRKNIKSLWE
ncbi:MAG TPA: mobile mystery protein A [Rickettsia endosymbiont of Sericostoma sp.]|jgi:predicted DNA-binding mobile mystery protein A|uniref:mobile mystery protein A n=1 Tax=unclassified Candidatus Tisiphia TaxID=2996318 RepID=UPI001D5E5EC3|nr:mobile mystery protein A [Rickettsia endosymbiont of Sericostoma sp. HW-2014]HJD64542.1 mobile mystery protein A [Rickettsia endosymbiont of Sericostoma sp.]